jgi:hypothetical protein
MAFVNESLSRGLACRAVAVLAAQGDRYRAGMLPIVQRRLRSKKSLSKVVEKLTQLGERCRLAQVIGKTPNGRQVSVCPLVPVRLLPSEQCRKDVVSFDLYQLLISVRGAGLGPDWGTALAASEHAIERLFLRLNTLDLGAVYDELHDAMLLAMPIALAGRALGLKQVALPTSSGAFLCDLPATGRELIAKTWISDCTLGARWTPVAMRIRQVVEEVGGDRAAAEFLALGSNGPLAEQSHPLRSGLERALAGFGWLEEEYVPRPDPVGDQWASARAAANAASMAP